MERPRVEHLTKMGPERVILENEFLRIEVLPGKGADVVAVVDREVDENLLFEAPHNWQPPGAYAPSIATAGDWLDYYPGGWQDCLPFGGQAEEVRGARYGLHGESALLPWEPEIAPTDPDRAEATFACDLVRYPFHVERKITLEAGDRTLAVEATIENSGRVELPFNWLQHICFGPPLVDPEATVSLPGGVVSVKAEPQGTSPLPPGETFPWPTGPDGTDLREVPALDAGIHDLFYVHDLPEGRYAIRNPARGLGVELAFDESLFEALWCWRSFEGIDGSPFFGRERLLGVEPATGWPSTDLPASQGPDGTGTLKTVGPGETVETILELTVLDVEE